MLEIGASIIQTDGQINAVEAIQQANYVIKLLEQIYASTVGYNVVYQFIAVIFGACITALILYFVFNKMLKHYAQQQMDIQATEQQGLMLRFDAIDMKLEAMRTTIEKSTVKIYEKPAARVKGKRVN